MHPRPPSASATALPPPDTAQHALAVLVVLAALAVPTVPTVRPASCPVAGGDQANPNPNPSPNPSPNPNLTLTVTLTLTRCGSASQSECHEVAFRLATVSLLNI